MVRFASMKRLATGLVLLAGIHVTAAIGQEQQPTPQQRAAMLKEWLAASQAQLRNYQWYSETVITVDGDKKSDVKDRCYYGEDGTLKTVSQGDSVKHSKPLPGLLMPGKLIDKIAEHQQEEMKQYVNNAIALLHSYVPPNTTDIQAAIHAGLMSVNMVDPGRRVQLQFRDFKKAGDQLSVDIELPTNRLLGIGVKSYLDSQDDAVDVQVTMGVMADGTIYTQNAVLQAPKKNLEITVTNSDFERIK